MKINRNSNTQEILDELANPTRQFFSGEEVFYIINIVKREDPSEDFLEEFSTFLRGMSDEVDIAYGILRDKSVLLDMDSVKEFLGTLLDFCNQSITKDMLKNRFFFPSIKEIPKEKCRFYSEEEIQRIKDLAFENGAQTQLENLKKEKKTVREILDSE